MLCKNRRQSYSCICTLAANYLSFANNLSLARRVECTRLAAYLLSTGLVIANPQQDFFAKPKCEPATRFLPTNLVIANSEKIFPRSLNVSLPRATLVPRVAWWKQSPYKLPAIPLLADRRTAFAMTTC